MNEKDVPVSDTSFFISVNSFPVTELEAQLLPNALSSILFAGIGDRDTYQPDGTVSIIYPLQQPLRQRQNHIKRNQFLVLSHTAGNLAKIMKLDFQRQRIPAEIGVLQSPHQLHCRMVQLYNDG